jgi:hypothetical protein
LFFLENTAMRKIALYVCALLLALIVLLVWVRQDAPLSPEARRALDYQAPDTPVAENAFIALVGFDAPAGADFMQAGAARIREAQAGKPFQTSVSSLKLTEDYRYYCVRDRDDKCLEDIRADAANIRRLLADNAELVERYRHAQSLPRYVNTLTSDIPNSGFGIDISRLLSAAAVLDIQAGQIDQGLAFIEDELRFQRRILAAREAVLLDQLIALAGIRRQLVLLELLNEQGLLRGQDARLRALLTPLEAPTESFRQVLWREHVFQMQGFAKMFSESGPEDLYTLQDLDTGEKTEATPARKLWAYAQYYFLFKPNMSLNLKDELWRDMTAILTETPASRLPARDVRREALARAGCWKIGPICKHPTNFVGEVLLMIDGPGLEDYLLRIHDVDARIRLLRAQLEYQLTTRPANEDPAQTLARLGPETFNPYTGKPFEWDAARGVLRFQPVQKQDADKPLELRLSPAAAPARPILNN